MLIYQLFAQNIFWTCSKAPLIPDKKIFFCLFKISYPTKILRKLSKNASFLFSKPSKKLAVLKMIFGFTVPAFIILTLFD